MATLPKKSSKTALKPVLRSAPLKGGKVTPNFVSDPADGGVGGGPTPPEPPPKNPNVPRIVRPKKATLKKMKPGRTK